MNKIQLRLRIVNTIGNMSQVVVNGEYFTKVIIPAKDYYDVNKVIIIPVTKRTNLFYSIDRDGKSNVFMFTKDAIRYKRVKINPLDIILPFNGNNFR